MRSHHHTLAFILTAGTCLALTAAASAQQIDTRIDNQIGGQRPRGRFSPGLPGVNPALRGPGGGGTALDANLSTTRGPLNTEVRDMDALYRFNNAVADGNAGYGKSLRVPTATTNFDGFRGLLGSESNYAWRTYSTSGAQVAAGITATDALQYQFASQAGLPISYRIADTLAVAPRGGISTGEAVSVANAVPDLRSVSQFQGTSSRLPTVLGYSKINETNMAIVASPLQGLGMVGMGVGPDGRTGLISGLEAASRGVPRPAEMLRYEEDKDRNRAMNAIDTRLKPSGTSYDVIVQSSVDAFGRLDTRAGAPPINQPPEKPKTEGAKPTDATKPIDPTKPTDPTRPFDPAKPADPSKPTDPNAPGDAGKPAPSFEQRLDNLRKLLDKTNREGGLALPARPSTDKNDTTSSRPVLDIPKAAPKPATPGAKPEDAPKLTPAEQKQRDAAEAATRAAETEAANRRAIREAITALAATNTRVDSFLLKGESPDTRFARLMTAGEEALAKGEYFDAEGLFVTAQGQKVVDVMSQVGAVHARIGAGLLASAANSLDDMLRLQPEVVPVRYGPRLLPPKARASELAVSLAKELKTPAPTTGPSTGLLLAYLGYQYDERAWLTDGLASLKAKLPADDAAGQKLVELVSGVWLAKAGVAPAEPAK